MTPMSLEKLQENDGRILLLGLGVNHRHLLRFLIEKKIHCVVADRSEGVKEAFFTEFPGLDPQFCTWKFIEPLSMPLSDFAILFRSPSIPWASPQLAQARAKGAETYSQTRLFLDFCPCTVVGITGTKGKGTTASLIAEILEQGYVKGKTYLAGNIGIDPFSFLDQLRSEDIVVLELSSFQLQDLERSPQVGVLLRVTADHLEHHTDLEEYRQAKYQLLKHQGPDDLAIINVDTPENAAFAKTLQSPVLTYIVADDLLQTGNTLTVYGVDVARRQLLGFHNNQNIIPAVLVGQHFGVAAEIISEVIATFRGLPHRLEKVSETDDCLWVDDSIATTPESGISSIAAFPSEPIHLIAGGNTKGSDYTDWCAYVKENCVSVSLLPGSMTDSVVPQLPFAYLAKGETGKEQMADIFANLLLKPGNVVLLAPAATSFASFGSYAERGDVFTLLAKKRCP